MRKIIYPTVALTRKNFDFTKKNSSDLLSSFLKPTDSVVAVVAKAPVKNLEMLNENVLITQNICSALSKQNINYLLNVGSDAVFQDSKSKLTEDSYRSPSSLHGVMHLMREISFDALGLSLGTIRPTLIYALMILIMVMVPIAFPESQVFRKHNAIWKRGRIT